MRIITFGFQAVLTNLLIQVEQDYDMGPIYLGEHADVQYSLHSNPQATNQELKSLWTRSTSPEILQADPSSNVYLHKVKFVQYGERQEAVQLHRVEYLNSLWKSTLALILPWQCKKCPYGSPLLPHHNRNPKDNEPTNPLPLSLFHPPANCALDILTDDCMYEI